MAALKKDRNTPSRQGDLISVKVAASAKIYAGSLVMADGGYAKPGAVAANKIALGRAEEQVDNSSGSAGDKSVLVRRGVFRWGNSTDAADKVGDAAVGSDAWIVDDQTVADNNGSSTRSKAGRILAVDAKGVWVETR